MEDHIISFSPAQGRIRKCHIRRMQSDLRPIELPLQIAVDRQLAAGFMRNQVRDRSAANDSRPTARQFRRLAKSVQRRPPQST
jgi:hypothetical protein